MKGLGKFVMKNTKPKQEGYPDLINYIEDLTLKLGVPVCNPDGTYRKLYDVLHDLSKAWAKIEEKVKEQDKIKLYDATEIITISDVSEIDKQMDYNWIAKSLVDGQYYVGYVFVDQPWYSSKDQWTYYLKYQVDINRHWEEQIVDGETIIPYTNRNKAWLNSKRGTKTVFATPEYFFDSSEKNILGTDIDEVIKKLEQTNNERTHN